VKKLPVDLFLDDFKAEAKTHIEKIESAFLSANIRRDVQSVINSVFRAAHSLKGTASFYSLEKIVAVSHELESVFAQIKDESLQIDDNIVDIVLQGIDCLKDLIDNTHDDSAINIKQLIEALKKYSDTEEYEDGGDEGNAGDIKLPFNCNDSETEKSLTNAIKHGHKLYYVKMKFKDEAQFDQIMSNVMAIGTVVQTIKRADLLQILLTSVLESDFLSVALGIEKENIHILDKDTIFQANTTANYGQAYVKSSELESNFSIRLDISVINNLMDLANEMILTRNQLFSIVSDYTKSNAGLAPVLYDVSRLTSEVQERIMFTRMQPISVIFEKFPRIIRDTAKTLGKEIAVEIIRDDVMLDKYLLDALTDPITQLVKNSADHGLEFPEQRVAAGKLRKGLISLNAYMRDNMIVIEILDDGKGIDVNSLKKKAVELNIMTEEALLLMPKNEILNLIFEQGISTARQVTSLSGRGFGMDIVKTNIENLGGTVEIESETGKGTVMRLNVPLTLSVIRTLIIKIDDIPYAVPDLNVERIVRISGNTASKYIERVNKSLVLVLDGEIIPIVTMSEMQAKAKGLEPVSADTLLEQNRYNGIVKCLVLKTGSANFALLISDALDTEQVLVKPLPVYLHNCPCYSNVTVLGSGEAVTILDAEGIMQYMGLDEVKREAEELLMLEIEKEEKQVNENEKNVVVFNCSGSEYYAVETSNIARIEIIYAENIQEIGEEQFVNVAEQTIQVLRPEDFAPVQKRNYEREKLYMLTIKNDTAPIGLLAGRVLDKIDDVFTLDDDRIYSDYILGTSVYKEKVIIFLDTAAIAESVEKDKVSRKTLKKEGAT